ncbi:hypothetical protein [Streptococcus mitis]|uniref:hypothetical protein n=1 Tax=Streptococcus mitis TaxID=28037 RepID=UPI00135F1B9A|nr:hypothetical protein [Streptococcus mitis]
MSSVYDKYVRPVINFLVFAFAKLFVDIVVIKATGWEYTNLIFLRHFLLLVVCVLNI